jgi:fatty-acyl-CoA synthase
MLGLMQDWPLTVDRILDHAASRHGRVEIVTRSLEGPIVRTNYGEVRSRAKRVSNALKSLGVGPGDRVATLAMNTARHLEAWYGIMGIGAICHTLNPRLHLDQLCWILTHAEDKAILVDPPFLPLLLSRLDQAPHLKTIIVMGDQAPPGTVAYEALIAEQSDECEWGGFDENTACGLCYTSGTTGEPKGVLYSHRSNFLHMFITLAPDAMGVGAADVVLPVVPMFHANAWGLAFATPAVGSKLVMPGAKLDGASLHELMETERVTFSAAVPTVWQALLHHLETTGERLTSLRRVVIGGSACPEALIRAFHDRHGVEVLHAWGMTELSPLGTVCSPNGEMAGLSFAEQFPTRAKQGRPPLGVELAIKSETGERVAEDGQSMGRLVVRGAAVAGAYFRSDQPILDEEGFFDTGDIATIDPGGFIQITDRAKDLIKSGGEWICSIEIENLAMAHPDAACAAVIAKPDEQWGERPHLLVQLKPGSQADAGSFRALLDGKIAKWWMPDEITFVEQIPLGATGKIDKKALRASYAA